MFRSTAQFITRSAIQSSGAEGDDDFITIGAAQFAVSTDENKNLETIAHAINDAKKRGIELLVLPELCYLPYFPKVKSAPARRDLYPFDQAETFEHSHIIKFMQEQAKAQGIMLMFTFFERVEKKHGDKYYNTLVMISTDGDILHTTAGHDRYRKAHIPDGPGYNEKAYFEPGDLPYPIWQTPNAKVGGGICWDQWYVEPARVMMLKGAHVACFPSAIGSEPKSPGYNTSEEWKRVMQGAAVGNRMPIIAVNRIGVETAVEQWDEEEKDTKVSLTFYGESFITEIDGSIKEENAAPRYCTTIISQRINVSEVERERKLWRVEERRPDLAHRIVKPFRQAYEFTKTLIHGTSFLNIGSDKKDNAASTSAEYNIRKEM